MESSAVYKNDVEFVRSLVENALEKSKQEAEKNEREAEIQLEKIKLSQIEREAEIQLEKIKISQIEKQLELAKVRKESEKNSQSLESGEPSSITDKLESLWVEVRCFLDVGSQSCLCTRACAEKLQLKMEKINTVVSCVNDASMIVKNCVKTSVADKAKTFESELMLLVVNKITDLIPNKVIDVDVNVSEFVPLADKFNIPDRIDMLLGAEIFYELLKPGKFYCDNSHLVLQNTVFGYVVREL
ncbi:DUF1758 domain-containing protein [Trichonephila clavipes]|nr:DUF1758 domain-containing protein [Trichonephila clavipes]